jgi:tetratricopeptide (TPR) repeat protein
VGVDRETTVKKAEEHVREGKTDLAIEEYLRLVEDQPGDIGAANALGDLYAKIGNRAQAVAQFVQIGDFHRDSGFVPKAVAFYKKALKVDPASDHALSQLAQIAVDQELYADATLYLNRLLQRRREQNNEVGVADCLVRLGSFPSATADAKTIAARAASGHFAQEQATRLWIDAADALERADRSAEAVDALMQAASLDTGDVSLRRRIAVACADSGQIERARAFLSFETAGDRGDLLLALAEHAIGEGRDDEARRALRRAIEVAPERRAEAESMLAPLMPSAPVDEGEAIALAASEPASAASGLLDDWGTVEVSAEPVGELGWDALLGGGESEPDAETDPATADDAEPEPEYAGEPELDNAGESEPEPEPVADVEIEPEPVAMHTGPPSGFEWSDLLGDAEEESTEPTVEVVESSPEGTGEPEIAALEDAAPEIEEPVPAPDAMAAVAVPASPAPAALPAAPAPPTAPVVAAAPGASPRDADTMASLKAAAQNPALQFQASAQLGRLLLRLQRTREGVEWLERATQATTTVREQRLDVMYELADALERLGDHARALDVFADLDFDAASFRDVPERMARLRRALEEGGAT